MLRRSPFGRSPDLEDWDLRLPLKDGLRELYARLQTLGVVTRSLERMPYCDSEFDIKDPDGYVICISQMLENASDIPYRVG